jgi:hypothetical protein
MILTEFVYRKGVITESKYQKLKLAWEVQQSGLNEKDAKLRFNISHDTYWRYKRLKIV